MTDGPLPTPLLHTHTHTHTHTITRRKISIVVSRTQVQSVCSAVIDSARTGEIGDGKVSCFPIPHTLQDPTPLADTVAFGPDLHSPGLGRH